MSDLKVKYANFPERDLKVVIGANINAATTKALGRLSIGTYEMSFVQQERGKVTADAARTALNHLARATGLTLTSQASRDYVCFFTAANAEHRYQIWVTTPFELTQSAHIVWVRYNELGGEGKVGVAFKFSTGFTVEDIEPVLKNALKNAVKLADGEAFTLKGNPPPRFLKKAAAPVAAETAPAEADPASAPPAST